MAIRFQISEYASTPVLRQRKMPLASYQGMNLHVLTEITGGHSSLPSSQTTFIFKSTKFSCFTELRNLSYFLSSSLLFSPLVLDHLCQVTFIQNKQSIQLPKRKGD